MNQPVLLFTGQGVQYSGMGRDIAENSTEAMEFWKKAEKISHLPLREIVWDGDEQELNKTSVVQPALTVVNLNLWRMLANKIQPVGCAGHSLGEFSALAASGVLDPNKVLEFVSLRGRLMENVDPEGKGGMAAIVKLSVTETEEIIAETVQECGEMLIAANYNTPAQLVISGTKKALQIAGRKAAERRGRAMPLKTGGAFHSPMMQEANQEFVKILQKAEWHKPRFPIYCNVDSLPADDAKTIYEKIKMQMISPVRWLNTITEQYVRGCRFWLELGAKAILGKMVKPCVQNLVSEQEKITVEKVCNLEDARSFNPA